MFKYSRETDTVKHFGNYVFQSSIADFVVVDEKDTKALTVDISTVDYQEVQKTLDVSEMLSLVYRLQPVPEGVLRPLRFGLPRL